MAEKEYIEREAALAAQNKSMNLAECRKRLERLPAADVAEVRHGRWVNERQEGFSSVSAVCNLCGKRTLAYFHYNYCPNCGAKMDGGQDE